MPFSVTNSRAIQADVAYPENTSIEIRLEIVSQRRRLGFRQDRVR
jgi:acyl-CoA hydrolase